MKPILFNTEMVRAILEGRKTVTRRVVKDPYYIDDESECRIAGYAMHRGTKDTDGMPYPDSPYSVNDILYVRETWEEWEGGYVFKAEPVPSYPHSFIDRWHPSIHMPKEAARIFLRVTDVRVERLRDITEEGAVSEGLYKGWRLNGRGSLALSARQAFMWLWETLTREAPPEESWAVNPWVWVIEFERCEKPEEG